MGNAVIFDMFGTLCSATSPELRIIYEYNLNQDVHDGLQRAVCGTKFQEWKPYLGGIAKAAGIEADEKNRQRIREIVHEQFEKGRRGVFPEADGVLRVLKERGFVLGLVSNAYPPSRRIVQEGNLEQYFSTVILSYEIGITKQSPEIYHRCLKDLGIDAERAVMVGDSLKSDILASKRASDEKIGGILLSDKMPKEQVDKLIVVKKLSEVPEAVFEYFR